MKFSQPSGPPSRHTFAEFLGLFADVESTRDGYLATCPTHPDSSPSLWITYHTDTRKIGMACRAGCENRAVVEAVGLTLADLSGVDQGDVPDIAAPAAPGPLEIGDRAALALYLERAAAGASAPNAAAIAAHDYAAERFGLDYARFTDLGLGYDDGTLDGGRLGLSSAAYHDVPRLVVPFRNFLGQPHGLQARALSGGSVKAKWSGPVSPATGSWGRYGYFTGGTGWAEVLICEGPGDALTGAGAGYDTVAVRGAALSGSVMTDLAENLRARRVILAGDNDAAGRAFNQAAGAALAAAGLSASILAVPSDHSDLTAWREDAPSAFEAALMAAVRNARPFSADSVPPRGTSDTVAQALARSDLANAERLYNRMGGLVRHASALGFLVWDGAAWREDADDTVTTAAIASARALGVEAAAMPDGDPSTPTAKAKAAAVSWARQSQSTRNMTDTVKMLRALESVAVPVSRLDAKPDLLACANGTVNLRTGELRAADPDDLLTKSLRVNYHPDAPAPRWERFMQEVFPDSPETVEYLHRLVGYGITGHATEQCYVVLHGLGGNGKSIFTSTLQRVFEPITENVNIETFLISGNQGSAEGPSTNVASLRGARLALTSESEHGARLAEARVKLITGGDPVTARHLYGRNFTFRPSFLLLMSTNGLPEVRGQDDGIWRRTKLIHWQQKFEGARRDKHLEQTLAREQEGILAWAVRGAMKWYADGIAEPRVIIDAVKDYRSESDKLLGFYPGKIVADSDGWISRADLYAAYQEWSESEGTDKMHQWRNTTLYSAISALGVEPAGRRGIRGFRGIRVARRSEMPGRAANEETPQVTTTPY